MRAIKLTASVLVAWFFVALAPATVLAQAKTLGVGEVKVLPAVTQAAGVKKQSLDRISQAMDSRLIAAFNETRKFTVLGRSDLDAIREEHKLQDSGLVDEATMVQMFKLAGAELVVVTTIDDFQDFVEKAQFEGIGEAATKRVIRLGAVAKIYRTETGAVFETASFQISNKDISRDRNYSTTDGELSDRLLTEMATTMADRVAARVTDVVYPARVLAKTGAFVMINRGDGTGIARDQVWHVYALGEEMIDPDTGVSLGAEEIEVGKVKVVAVMPKFSRAEVVEDYGIDKLQVLRMAAPSEAE